MTETVSAKAHVDLLNKWADALEELPSGPFASEDIRAAATALASAEARIAELTEVSDEMVEALFFALFPGWPLTTQDRARYRAALIHAFAARARSLEKQDG